MWDRIREKNLHTWLDGWVGQRLARLAARRYEGTRHLIFALCDHHEPLWGGADDATGLARVRTWHDRYPPLADRFRDADGRTPQHTFFFPGEEYRPGFFDALDDLVRRGYGEVELHLHHDDSTRDRTRDDILRYLEIYAARGHFSREPSGRIRYAFIHGNWALANGRPDGRRCGVDDELPLLFDTGCYADFTFPSAPDITQPRRVNELYWPVGDLRRKRSYEQGERARVGKTYRDRILMIEGPLALARRPGTVSVRIDSAALTAKDPATPARIRTWVAQDIHVAGRPEWVFVKVHTHGAPEQHAASLLGPGGLALHEHLTSNYNDGVRWILHYVTAREMFNIAMAAMEYHQGDPNAWRDYLLPPPPLRAA